MKKITIEEVISQEFEVDDNATYDEIRKMYKNSELVLDNPSVTQVNVQMNEDEDWIDLHIN